MADPKSGAVDIPNTTALPRILDHAEGKALAVGDFTEVSEARRG